MNGRTTDHDRVTAALGAGGRAKSGAPAKGKPPRARWRASLSASPTGLRFLTIQSADTQRGDRGHLTLATNWLSELERLAPAK
jgi:hypothetical protein